MKYGYIIKMNNSDNFYFIHYIDNEKMYLINSGKNTNEKEIFIFEDLIKNENEINIIYKPYTSSYIILNNYRINENIFIKSSIDKDSEDIIYKIINLDKIKDSMKVINVATKKEEEIIFNFRGLPKNIENIQKIAGYKTNNGIKNNYNKEIISIDKQEEEEYYYYYSIEQQVNVIIEDLLTEGSESEKNIILKTINRYKELYSKYYNENNEYISINNTYNVDTSDYKLYIPITNNVKIIGHILNETNPITTSFTNPYFTIEDNMKNFYDSIDNEINNYDLLNQIIINNTDEYKIKINEGNDLYIYPGTLYELKIQENMMINIDGIYTKPKDILIYDILNSKNSSILDKCSGEPIYLSNKHLESYNILDIKELNKCEFFTDSPIFYKLDKNETIDENIKKILPNTYSFIKCLPEKCYSIKSIISKLSLLNISEINKKDYKNIINIIKRNIELYKEKYNKKKIVENRKIVKNNKNIMNMDTIINTYFFNDYYSNSEYFNNVNKELLNFIIKKKNIYDNLIQIEINVNKTIPKKIVKYYKTNEEMLYDQQNFNEQLYKDEGNMQNYYSSVEKLYKTFIDLKFSGSKEEFVKYFKYEKIDDKYNTDNVKTFIMNNKIQDGDICLVISDNKKYYWSILEKKWEDNVPENDEKITSELFNKTLNENERTKMYYSDSSLEKQIKKFKYIENIKKKKEHKYNNQKIKYSNLVDSSLYVSSPHLDLFHEILSDSDLNKRMKGLMLFISINTINNENDIHWLYCKDSGLKLVPMFYKELSDAFSLGIDIYEKKIEQICIFQGKNEDDKWVDKYSGYTIQNINFDNEEGYTKEGFKISTREILSINENKEVIVSKYDNELYKNIRTIVDLINIDLNEEDVQKIIEYINICIGFNTHNTEKNKNVFYIYSLLSVFYIYIQSYKDIEDIESFYYNCKPDFSGFPLNGMELEENDGGINYIICIFKNIRKNTNTYPWDSVTTKNIKINLHKFIKTYTFKVTELYNTLKQKIKDNRENNKKIKKLNSSQWDLFLPRLQPINVNEKTNYKKTFHIQQNVNNFMIKQKNLKKTKDFIQYVSLDLNSYYLNNTDYILKPKFNIKKTLYFKGDSKTNLYKIKHQYTKNIIYKKLFSLLSNKVETSYEKYKAPNYLELNKEEQLNSLMQHSIEETEYLNIIKEDCKIFKLDIKEEDKTNNDELLSKLLGLKIKIVDGEIDITDISLFDKMYKNIKKKLDTKLFINIENIQSSDYDYYSDIMINRIIDILTLYIKKVNNVKKYSSNKQLCNIWDLSIQHKSNIRELLISSNIYESIIDIDIDISNISEIKDLIETYKILKSININNKHFRLKASIYLLNEIIDKFINNRQLKQIFIDKYKLFNKIINNSYNIVNINKDYEKEVEKELITDKFKKMSIEQRKLETELKQHKMKNWSKGLSDNMFKYSKEGYDKEINENNELLNLLSNYDDNYDEPENIEENDLEDYIERENED